MTEEDIKKLLYFLKEKRSEAMLKENMKDFNEYEKAIILIKNLIN